MQRLPKIENFSLRFIWSIEQSDQSLLPSDLVAVLREARHTGTLVAAAKRAGMSYRKVLNLVAVTETALGKAVVRKAQGKGVELSPLGQAIVRVDDQLVEAITFALERRPEELEMLCRFLVQPKPSHLRLCLSHDIFLMRAAEVLPSELHQALEVKFDGSLNSLRQFARGECEVAGFHLPTGKLGQSVGAAMRPYLEQPDLLIQPLLKRVQGLMFRQDSVFPISGLRDLLRPGIRFVNRQRNSGTRLVFDALLAEVAIPVRQINGYRHEEFTHSAVAAEVASGAADVGFGTGAAAKQYSLQFLPLTDEIYSLVWHKSRQDDAHLQALLAFLKEFIGRWLTGAEPYEGQLMELSPLSAMVYLAQFVDN